ncbi:MAG: ArnT family glycosyltransferase, partial [Rhabdochlamydiaceae bacterium]
LLVFVTGMIARELGGGRKAQLLAAISTLVTLDLLAFGSILTPDSFDSLWWSLLAYLIIRIVRRKEPKLWILAGLVVGIGLLTKLTILFFVAALLISFLAIPSSRKYLRSKWIAAGGLLSIAFILPMIYWNSVNGWLMIQFYQEFRGDVSGGGPLNFIMSQVAGTSFLNVPIFLIGLYFYLRSEGGRELRAIGLAYIILFVFMTALDMKVYYLMPAYPMLYAGGALLIEKSSTSKKGAFKWFGSKPFIACLIIVAILLAPVVIPVFSPSTMIRTYGTSDYQTILADRYGWSMMLSNLSQAYNTLPASERSQACIFTSNYGEASTVNFLGKSLGLPKAISGHNNYYIWGPDSCTGQVLITVGIPLSTAQQSYKNVSTLTTLSCQYCISYEQILPVYLCTNPNFTSLAAVWSGVKDYS